MLTLALIVLVNWQSGDMPGILEICLAEGFNDQMSIAQKTCCVQRHSCNVM